MPQSVPLEIRSGSSVTQLGPLAYSLEFIRTITKAEQALASLCSEGLLQNERKAEYEVLVYLASFEMWSEYWAAQSMYYVPLDDALIERMRRLLAPADAELVMVEQIHATRFARLG